jgi:hypothetical protein
LCAIYTFKLLSVVSRSAQNIDYFHDKPPRFYECSTGQPSRPGHRDIIEHRMIANLYSNRVFEYVHAREIKKVKDDGTWTSAQLETIVHPNEYFKRSYLLKNLGRAPTNGAEGDVVVKGEAMEE